MNWHILLIGFLPYLTMGIYVTEDAEYLEDRSIARHVLREQFGEMLGSPIYVLGTYNPKSHSFELTKAGDPLFDGNQIPPNALVHLLNDTIPIGSRIVGRFLDDTSGYFVPLSEHAFVHTSRVGTYLK